MWRESPFGASPGIPIFTINEQDGANRRDERMAGQYSLRSFVRRNTIPPVYVECTDPISSLAQQTSICLGYAQQING